MITTSHFTIFQKLTAAGYDVTLMMNPTEEEVGRKLEDDNLEGVIFIGHGGKGSGKLGNGGRFRAKLVRDHRRNRKRLRFIVLESCTGWNDGSKFSEDTVGDWANVCDEFVAYEHATDQLSRLRWLDPDNWPGSPDPDWRSPLISGPRGIPRGPRPWIPGGGGSR